MREILDPLDPETAAVVCLVMCFAQLQRGKALEPFQFYRHSTICWHWTGQGTFRRRQIHCDSCLQKVNKKTGEVTYHHQMVGAVIVHP